MGNTGIDDVKDDAPDSWESGLQHANAHAI